MLALELLECWEYVLVDVVLAGKVTSTVVYLATECVGWREFGY